MTATLTSLSDRQAAELLRGALDHLLRNDFEAADRTIGRVLEERPDDPDALHLFGQMRRVQNRFDEAERYYRRTIEVSPKRAEAHFHLAQLLRVTGRPDEAAASIEDAIRCRPGYPEANVELGLLLATKGDFAGAEKAFRDVLRRQPNLVAAKQGLVNALIGLGRFKEAEATVRSALLLTPRDPRQTAVLCHNLGTILSEQQRHGEAVRAFEQAQKLAPDLPHTDYNKAGSLEMLGAVAEAEAAYRSALARDPSDLKAHRALNRLLYRMAREDFLSSYDQASAALPLEPRLFADKARFLYQGGRHDDACEAFSRALALAPDDPDALDGLASSLAKLGRFDEAIAQFEHAVRIDGGNAEILCDFAECLLRAGDPAKSAAVAQDAMSRSPHHQLAIALWTTALRQQNDGRETGLNDYENFIQVFDLAPPEGFSDMASFNAELEAYLGKLHFDRREHINQTSRYGTKTQGSLFGAGHPLVEKLKLRIDEAVTAYISRMKEDDTHPLLSRRARTFSYPGCWSTRLGDGGYHTNHVHPWGWISSAYYVSLPDAVNDEAAHQGWLKFGEASFGDMSGASVRRRVKPAPGRLVLFPSYFWHGTQPFHSGQTRTTVAFDAVPVSG